MINEDVLGMEHQVVADQKGYGINKYGDWVDCDDLYKGDELFWAILVQQALNTIWGNMINGNK